MYLYPRSTSIVKLRLIPELLPLKIIPWTLSLSRKIFSNDKISTGLCDKLSSSYNVLALNPKISRILSSNIKLIIGPCGEISIIDANVENFGLILNG